MVVCIDVEPDLNISRTCTRNRTDNEGDKLLNNRVDEAEKRKPRVLELFQCRSRGVKELQGSNGRQRGPPVPSCAPSRNERTRFAPEECQRAVWAQDVV